MSVARRFAAALAVVGLGVLAYAVPASATESGASDLPCVDGTVKANLEGVVEALEGTALVRGKGGAPICEGTEVKLTLSTYKVPDTWDGNGFPSRGAGKAWPQTALEHDRGTLSGSEPLKLQVPLPTCGNVQIDLYTGAPIQRVFKAGHPIDRILFGYIWSVGGPNGNPKLCDAEPPTPSAVPSTTPAAPATSPAVPVPPASSSAVPVPPGSVSPEPSVSPGTVQPTPSATQGISAPLPVVPPQLPAPPALAETGSNSTVPLLGLGVALLGAGVLLSLLGRRRTA